MNLYRLIISTAVIVLKNYTWIILWVFKTNQPTPISLTPACMKWIFTHIFQQRSRVAKAKSELQKPVDPNTLQSSLQSRPSWATMSPGACRKYGRKKRSCTGSLSLSGTRDLPLQFKSVQQGIDSLHIRIFFRQNNPWHWSYQNLQLPKCTHAYWTIYGSCIRVFLFIFTCETGYLLSIYHALEVSEPSSDLSSWSSPVKITHKRSKFMYQFWFLLLHFSFLLLCTYVLGFGSTLLKGSKLLPVDLPPWMCSSHRHHW